MLDEKIKNLKSYQLNCNVFSVYDYPGYDIQELLCQFFTRINECINISNQTIDLVKWLVNEGLKIEVAKKLEEWFNDGTLSEIINEIVFKELNEKIDKIGYRVDCISVDELGAKGDGISDDSFIIQQADDMVKKGGKVVFGNKTYRISNTVFKSQYTTWEGVSNNNYVGEDYYTKGTKILSGFNGTLIHIKGVDDTPSYGGRGIIKNMAFWNDYKVNHSACAIKQSGIRIKGLCFENLDIKNFYNGIWLENASFCEFTKIYIVSKYALRCDSISDSEFIRVEVGNNIPSKNRDDLPDLYNFFKGGYGLRCVGINPVTNGGNKFIDCRFQLASDTYYCAMFERMRGLQFINTIVDENESIGILFKDCEHIDITNTMGWNNGKKDNPQFTLQFENCRSVNVIGGQLFNRPIGHINDYKGKGVMFDSVCVDAYLISTRLADSLVQQVSGLSYVTPIFTNGFKSPVSLLNGWQLHDDSKPFEVEREGSMFRIQGVIKGGTKDKGTIIGTIPIWLCRSVSTYLQIYVDNQTTIQTLAIRPNGNIEIVTPLEQNSYIAINNIY